MLRRWKERMWHDVGKILILSYASITIAFLLGYFVGIILNPWIGITIPIAGTVLTFAWITWITS